MSRVDVDLNQLKERPPLPEMVYEMELVEFPLAQKLDKQNRQYYTPVFSYKDPVSGESYKFTENYLRLDDLKFKRMVESSTYTKTFVEDTDNLIGHKFLIEITQELYESRIVNKINGYKKR